MIAMAILTTFLLVGGALLGGGLLVLARGQLRWDRTRPEREIR